MGIAARVIPTTKEKKENEKNMNKAKEYMQEELARVIAIKFYNEIEELRIQANLNYNEIQKQLQFEKILTSGRKTVKQYLH